MASVLRTNSDTDAAMPSTEDSTVVISPINSDRLSLPFTVCSIPCREIWFTLSAFSATEADADRHLLNRSRRGFSRLALLVGAGGNQACRVGKPGRGAADFRCYVVNLGDYAAEVDANLLRAGRNIADFILGGARNRRWRNRHWQAGPSLQPAGLRALRCALSPSTGRRRMQ